MDVQLAGLFWSTSGAKPKHFALKLDCASPSPHSAPAWPRNETARGSAHHCLSGTRAMATRRQRGSQRRRGTSFPPASDKSILWWPQRCDRVLYGRIKNRERCADVEIVFQTAGSGFPGPLGASSGTAGPQEGSPFYCATHLA